MMMKTYWSLSARDPTFFCNTLHEFVTLPLIYLGYGEDLGPRQLSRCSVSLRSGQFRDRIPVGTGFSASVQTGPVAHPASYTINLLCAIPLCDITKTYTNIYVNTQQLLLNTTLFYTWRHVSAAHTAIFRPAYNRAGPFICAQYGIPLK